MGFNCGIVGLPNVGKSTLFNALLATAQAEAANYPFCTIEPNVGKVGVPDARLDTVAAIGKSAKIIPTSLEFVDIAGLVKGASRGEGLGNQFLSHIKQVDAIIHVVRCFENGDVVHVEGGVDPVRDAEIVNTELILADLDSLNRKVDSQSKKAKGGDKEAREECEVAAKIITYLNDGKLARLLPLSEHEKDIAARFQLITMKPMMYACNVDESEITAGNQHTARMKDYAISEGTNAEIISAKIESEISALDSEADKFEMLTALGLTQTGLARIVSAGYGLLNLITFFTVGPKEARAWTVEKNSTAPQAAGKIHTDFEKGFIRAETIGYDDFVRLGGEQGCKEAGKLRLEGKEYIVQDGDILHFRFNV